MGRKYKSQIPNPKSQAPNPKPYEIHTLRNPHLTESSLTKSNPLRNPSLANIPTSRKVLIWDLGFGVWGLGFGICYGNAADGFSVRTFVRDMGRSVSRRAKP
jgi:hypothetical protein